MLLSYSVNAADLGEGMRHPGDGVNAQAPAGRSSLFRHKPRHRRILFSADGARPGRLHHSAPSRTPYRTPRGASVPAEHRKKGGNDKGMGCAHDCNRRTRRNRAYAPALCPPTAEGADRVRPREPPAFERSAVGDLFLWIVLISTALGTGCTAWMSSGTGGLWRVDALELRRQQRFEQVLSSHVDAIRRSHRTVAAPTEAPAYRRPLGAEQPGAPAAAPPGCPHLLDPAV